MQHALTAVILSLTLVLSTVAPLAVASTATSDPLAALGFDEANVQADVDLDTVPDQSEPNDDFDTATPITVGTTSQGRLDPSEADVYAFTGAAGQPVTVALTRTTTAGAVAIVLYGPDREQLTFEFVGSDTPASMTAVPAQAGTHYVQVVDLGSAAGAYSLQVTGGNGPVTPPPGGNTDTNEPNDSPTEATDLPRGGTVEGAVESSTDVDYFRFTSDGTPIEIPVTRGTDGSGPLGVQLHLPNGQPGSDVTPLAVGATLTIQGTLAPGDYFVSLRSLNGGLGSYSLQYSDGGPVSPPPGGNADANEPNDDTTQATPLAVGQTLGGTIAPASDEDWFAFQAPGGVSLPIEVARSGGTGTFVFQIRDANGQPASPEFTVSPGQATRIVGTPSAGTWFVRVRTNDAGSGSYQISLERGDSDTNTNDAGVDAYAVESLTFFDDPEAEADSAGDSPSDDSTDGQPSDGSTDEEQPNDGAYREEPNADEQPSDDSTGDDSTGDDPSDGVYREDSDDDGSSGGEPTDAEEDAA